MANAISCSRIVISAWLLFFPALSPAFYALYLLAGLSDMLDGPVARGTGKASEFGSRLDTAADFAFVAVCLIKLLPTVEMPAWLVAWAAVIALIKGINVVSGYIINGRLAAVHSPLNKAAGAALFALPLTFPLIPLKYSAIVACTVATVAAVQEGRLIRMTACRSGRSEGSSVSG